MTLWSECDGPVRFQALPNLSSFNSSFKYPKQERIGAETLLIPTCVLSLKSSPQRRMAKLAFDQFCLALACLLPNSTEMSITTSWNDWFVVLLANRLQVFV